MKPLVLLKTFILVYFGMFPIAYLGNEVSNYVFTIICVGLALLLLSGTKEIVSRSAKTLLLLYIPVRIIAAGLIIYCWNNPAPGSVDFEILFVISSISSTVAAFCMMAAIILSNFDMKLNGLVVLEYLLSQIPVWSLVTDGTNGTLFLIGIGICRGLFLVGALLVCMSWNEITPSEAAFRQSKYRNLLCRFVPYGSIARTEYVVSCLVCVLVIVCFAGVYIGVGKVRMSVPTMSYTVNALVGSVVALIYNAVVWVMTAQSARRCHDLGRSGWMQFVPFYNLVLLFKK